jgi:phosphocarrier protein
MAETESGTTTIKNTYGFHVRPAGRFLELVQQYQSTVEVTAGGQTVPADSPMGLLALGAARGDEVTVTCRGPDAREALQALLALIDDRFGGIE